jgi:hypothetical protein
VKSNLYSRLAENATAGRFELQFQLLTGSTSSLVEEE